MSWDILAILCLAICGTVSNQILKAPLLPGAYYPLNDCHGCWRTAPLKTADRNAHKG